MNISCERVYDWKPEDSGDSHIFPVLVDRLWPRGIKKERLEGVTWDKEVAPSPDLRKRFHSGVLSFNEFASEYRSELEHTGAAEKLLARASKQCTERPDLILLYAAKDKEHNHCLVLADYLREA
ncbi:MAG: DUF488 domain-containing protein [Ancrocorticia sp.]|uniref:DUF488 domain-containing protein n=1 Tax=Ancrocorticia sp. TaxID=2593684 RepID=UPI003F90EB4D